jgi:molecular chaperone IbpA
MRSIDFSPIFRSSVGFDRMAQVLDHHLRATEVGTQPSYPPYNIERLDEDNYRVTMAVAGFGEDDITITAQNNSLLITGKLDDKGDADSRTYLHRSIAARAFERRFDLAEHIQVTAAELSNGLLHVALVRDVPEAMKPRRIDIKATPALAQHAA